MRKRKLIPIVTIKALIDDIEIGVPLARAMRNHGIDMSRPAVAKLVNSYVAADKTEDTHLHTTIMNSLFPIWLVTVGQEQPDNVAYEGFFPLGCWVYVQ